MNGNFPSPRDNLALRPAFHALFCTVTHMDLPSDRFLRVQIKAVHRPAFERNHHTQYPADSWNRCEQFKLMRFFTFVEHLCLQPIDTLIDPPNYFEIFDCSEPMIWIINLFNQSLRLHMLEFFGSNLTSV